MEKGLRQAAEYSFGAGESKVSGISWLDRLFYVFCPVGIVAAIRMDCPWMAVVMAWCFGNLFQNDLRKWAERIDEVNAE